MAGATRQPRTLLPPRVCPTVPPHRSTHAPCQPRAPIASPPLSRFLPFPALFVACPLPFLSFPFHGSSCSFSPLALSLSNQRAPRSGSQDLAPACMALACAAMDLHHPIRRRRPLWLKIKTSGSMSRALSSYCIMRCDAMRCEMYTDVPPSRSTDILWTPH